MHEVQIHKVRFLEAIGALCIEVNSLNDQAGYTKQQYIIITCILHLRITLSIAHCFESNYDVTNIQNQRLIQGQVEPPTTRLAMVNQYMPGHVHEYN